MPVTNAKSVVPVVAPDVMSAVVRTALTKSASCKTMKENATSDARIVDTIRPTKVEINSVVTIRGIVSIEANGKMEQRVDRIKLLGQATANILTRGEPVTNDALKAEMDSLYKMYKDFPDNKQPDAETFDSMIARLVSQDALEVYKQGIRKLDKAGVFSVSDLEIEVNGGMKVSGSSTTAARQVNNLPEALAPKEPRTKRSKA